MSAQVPLSTSLLFDRSTPIEGQIALVECTNVLRPFRTRRADDCLPPSQISACPATTRSVKVGLAYSGGDARIMKCLV